MTRIPEEIIRSVQDQTDIIDVISRFVTLKRSGSSFKGLCPFHEEKTPSFHAFPNSGRYKCFGCGKSGDAFTFLMEKGNMGFRDAIEELASDAGITIPQEEASPAEEQKQRRRGAALQALDFAASFYRALLDRDAGAGARDYLQSRGFTQATIETFRIGFSPDSFEGLLHYARQKGYSEEVLADAGLLRRNDRGNPFDMFRGRIMFPIHDLRGRVIGFGARAMGDAQPKYLNSPDGPLFHKGREIYGLHTARVHAIKEGRLLLVEGYTDVMQCYQAGVMEVAAGLGTALTPDNARQLRRFNVPVMLVYDGDEAGLRAAERAADVLLAEQVQGAVVLLPPGNDPADLVSRQGREALDKAVAEAEDLWHYRVRRTLARNDTSTPEGRGTAIEELMATIVRIGDPVRREVALKLLSERVGVHELTLRDQLKLPRPPRAPAGEPDAGPKRPEAWRHAALDFVQATLAGAPLWERVEAIYPPELWHDPELAAIAGGIRNLRSRGESITREGLLAELADQDGAIAALQAIETDDEAATRATRHLDRIDDRKQRRSALDQEEDQLRAIVRARGGSLNEDS